MTVDEIIKYVMNTPHNTNKAVLKPMLESLAGEGGSAIGGYSVAYYNLALSANRSLYHEVANTANYNYEKVVNDYIARDLPEDRMSYEEALAFFESVGEEGKRPVPTENAHILLYRNVQSVSEYNTMPVNSNTDIYIRYGKDGYGFVTFYNEAGDIVWHFYADGGNYDASSGVSNILNEIYPNKKNLRKFYTDPKHTQEITSNAMLSTYSENTNFYIVDSDEIPWS